MQLRLQMPGVRDLVDDETATQGWVPNYKCEIQ